MSAPGSPRKRKASDMENQSPIYVENRYSEIFRSNVNSLSGKQLLKLVLTHNAYMGSAIRKASLKMTTEVDCHKRLRMDNKYQVSMDGGNTFFTARLFDSNTMLDDKKRVRCYFAFMDSKSELHIVDGKHFDANLVVITPM